LPRLWIYHHRHFKNCNWFCTVHFIFHYSYILGHNKTWQCIHSLLFVICLLAIFSSLLLFFYQDLLLMPIPSKSELYKIQRSYVIPVKNDYWTMHQTAILSVLSCCEPLHICGDGWSDSPGFSVKYTSYTIMDIMTSPVTEGFRGRTGYVSIPYSCWKLQLCDPCCSYNVKLQKCALETDN